MLIYFDNTLSVISLALIIFDPVFKYVSTELKGLQFRRYELRKIIENSEENVLM